MGIMYAILIVYLGIMLAIGIYGRKFAGNMEDYLAAGKQGTMIMVTASFMASHIGSGFVIGGAEKGAAGGISGVMFGFACTLSYLAFALIVSRRAYRGEHLTIPDYLDKRYEHKSIEISFAVINIFASIGIIGGQIMAGQRLFQAIGMNGLIGAVVTTLIVIGYASISGLWGVMMTDVIQVSVVIIGLIATGIYILVSGGWELITSGLPAQAFNILPSTSTELIMILVPTTLYGLISQPSFQRVRASKTEKIAIAAPVVGGLLLIPIAFLPVLIGMYGRVLFPEAAMGVVFFKVLMEVFNPLFAGIVIAAVLAAIMSTADTMLMGVTAHVIHDLYEKHINPDVDQKKLAKIGVYTTFGVGILGLITAVSFTNIISLLSFTYTILVSVTLAPVLLGMLWKGGNDQGAIVSMIVGFVTIMLNRFGVFTLSHTIFAVVPSFIAYILVSIMTKNKKTVKES